MRTGINDFARRRSAGFTIMEVMITMAVLGVTLSGLLALHLFGVRTLGITKAKLGASSEARRALTLLVEEVRSAKIVKVGQGNANTFTEVPVNQPQLGNAVQIYGSTNTNVFVRYFYESAERALKRIASGAAAPTTVATCISNSTVFAAEDFAGGVLTNNVNNRVISLRLQFYQLQDPNVPIGPGNFFDYYQLTTRITRRTLE